jgi:P4 family phage/plasmid primase-like protien
VPNPSSNRNGTSTGPTRGEVSAARRKRIRSTSDIELTDVGIARYVYGLHPDDVLLVNEGPTRNAWYAWTGRGWARQDNDQIVYNWVAELGLELRDFARKLRDNDAPEAVQKRFADWGRRLRSNVGIEAAVRAMRRQAPTALLGDFDTDGWALAFGDGVLYLTETPPYWRFVKWAKVPRAESRFLMNTGVDWRPNARDELWDSALKTFLPDSEERAHVQKTFGSTLRARNPLGLVIVLVGPTLTGKTTIADSIRAALGDYGGPFNPSVFRGKLDDGPREDVADVMRKRLVVAGEVGKEFELHADQVKRMSGDEQISYARKYGHQQNAYPDFMPVITTNDPPHIKSADLAVKKRLMGVPFNESMPERNDIALKLKESRAARTAILAWLVKGWQRYCEEGLERATWPLGVDLQTEELFTQLDYLSMFIEELCETCPTDEPRSTYAERDQDLWRAFKVWQDLGEVNVRSRLDRMQFLAQLRGLGFESGTSKHVRDAKGKVTRARCGLRLSEAGRTWSGDKFTLGEEAKDG